MKAKTDLKLSKDLEMTKLKLHKMSQLAMRRGRVASIAMIARRTAQIEKEEALETLERLQNSMSGLHLQTSARQAIINAHIDQIDR